MNLNQRRFATAIANELAVPEIARRSNRLAVVSLPDPCALFAGT